MDKLSKFGLISGVLAIATLFITIQANAVANSSTDNQIIMLGNQQGSIDQVPKPPEIMGKSVFDGFYLGIGPNLTALTGEGKSNITRTVKAPHPPGEGTWPLSDYNIGVSGFGGIGKVFSQKIYLGGELFANYSPLRTRGYNSHVTNTSTGEQTHGYSADVKSYYNLGGALRIGYLLSQRAIIYALVGGDYTQFKVISHDGNKPGGIHVVTPMRTKNVVAFMPGVGIESMLNKNWALRAQYTYSIYPEFKDAFTGSIEKDVWNPTYVKLKYNLARNIFSLAAIYHFNSPDTQNLFISPYNISERSLLNGFYIGVGPELIATTGETKVYSRSATSIDKVPLRISSYYPGVGILGGYGSSYKLWYVGSELFASYSPVRSKLHTVNGDHHVDVYKVRSDFSYGAALRGGYMLSSKLMAYALLGVDFSRFEVNSEKGYDVWLSKYISTPQKTRTLIGFMPGVGIESTLYKNLSIRAQYTYSLYTNIKDSYIRNGTHISVKYEPARSTFSLLLSYHFM